MFSLHAATRSRRKLVLAAQIQFLESTKYSKSSTQGCCVKGYLQRVEIVLPSN